MCFILEGCNHKNTWKKHLNKTNSLLSSAFTFCPFAFDCSFREPVFCQTAPQLCLSLVELQRNVMHPCRQAKKREKKTPNSNRDCFSAPGATEGKMSMVGVKSLKGGERGSTVVGHGASPRLRARRLRASKRTDNLKMSFDICVRRTRCEQDEFDSERHTVSFSLSSILHLYRPSCQGKKKCDFFSLA